MKSIIGLTAAAFAITSADAYTPGNIRGLVNPTGPASGSAETPTQTLIDGSSKSIASSSEATPSSHDSSAGNDALRCSSKCLDVYSPVLGDDGIMYPSYCAMELAKCEKSGKEDDWYARYKVLYGSSRAGHDDHTGFRRPYPYYSFGHETPSTDV
ncbi:hypothetical protein F441_17837 [Phytophthora nicotianae CJ01A1]|uniref:Kazal-like domain-containing protein n=1 Tax=Phytophthora nicotianae CJ01A1 TaxID=1317063 RepID=W2W7J3_PHYNI|nr:hypothetical protein F441_17837 [Phytophthora nicotianae CJ01A1]